MPIYYDVSPAIQISCIENLKIQHLSSMFRGAGVEGAKKKKSDKCQASQKDLKLRCAGHDLISSGGNML